MNPVALTAAFALLSPHLVGVALISTRLFPVTLLSPVLGPAQAPMHVRLGLMLSLALTVHLCGGVGTQLTLDAPWPLLGAVLRELSVGTAIGLLAALPFDAARIGGRFIDLFRGASAEAALPLVGSRDSATADGLHQLTVALVSSVAGLPLIVTALFHSFALLPVGEVAMTGSAAFHVVSCAMVALATGLSLAAPVLGGAIAVDLVLGLVGRALPQFALQELSSPLKILGGGTLIWLGLGVLSERLLESVARSSDQLSTLFQVLR